MDVVDVLAELPERRDRFALADALVEGVLGLGARHVEVVFARGAHLLARAERGAVPTDGARPTRVERGREWLSVRVAMLGAPPSAEPLAAVLASATLACLEKLEQLAAAEQSAAEGHDLVGLVSHDLRTPLQSLELGLDTLTMLVTGTSIGPSCSGTLARMKRAIEAASRLLSEVGDVGRIRDGTLSLQLRACHLDRVVAAVVDEQRPVATARGLRVELGVAELGAAVCDAERIREAVTYLVEHAIREATRGPIVVRTGRDEAMARIEVEARTGATDDADATLFARLRRRARAGRHEVDLRPYLAKGIVQAHGGRIGVGATPARATVLWIELPLRRS